MFSTSRGADVSVVLRCVVSFFKKIRVWVEGEWTVGCVGIGRVGRLPLSFTRKDLGETLHTRRLHRKGRPARQDVGAGPAGSHETRFGDGVHPEQPVAVAAYLSPKRNRVLCNRSVCRGLFIQMEVRTFQGGATWCESSVARPPRGQAVLPV